MWLVFTGCTAGLGLELVKHLVRHDPSANFVVICRNSAKARRLFVIEEGLVKQADGSLHIVVGNNASFASITSAADTIRELTTTIDCLFLNAGTMGDCHLHLPCVFRSLLKPWELPYRFATGDGIVKYTSRKTADGFEEVFQTNALSHFALIKRLQTCDIKKVVWTSSNVAQPQTFSIQDIEGAQAENPYGSSKFLTNLMSTKMSFDEIPSYICDPGTFSSNITLSMVPVAFKYLLVIFLILLQPFVPKLTRTPQNAMQALLQAYKKDADHKQKKYESLTSFTGNPYVDVSAVSIDSSTANAAWNEMERIYEFANKNISHL